MQAPSFTSPKGIVSRNEYIILSKKDHCESARKGIYAHGSLIGKIETSICIDKECKAHRRGHSNYKHTPAEKKRREKQRKSEKARKAREEKEIAAALKKIRWPMSEKVLKAILEKQLRRGSQILRPVVKRHGLEVKVVVHKDWKERDIEGTLRDAVKKMKPREKLQLVIEIILEDSWEEAKREIIKTL